MEDSRRTFKYVFLKLKSKMLAYFTTGCHNLFLCKFLRSLPFVKSICKKLKSDFADPHIVPVICTWSVLYLKVS